MITFTLKEAKGMYFDPKAFADPIARAKRKILNEFGATVRKIGKNSIKQGDGKKHSSPGKPPISGIKRARYKDFIFYVWDKQKDSVVIGAVILPRKDRTRVPGVLEHGGETESRTFEHGVRRAKTVTQEARPHMQPAFDKAVESKLAKLIEHSIVKG